MPPGIAPQDPSTSPTYAMSSHQTDHTAANSIRRNLFAGHLSRRPTATDSQNPFGPTSSTNEVQFQAALFPSTSSIQAGKQTQEFNNVHDSDGSPSLHTQSSMLQTNLSRESIIALHPVTGRPLLPNLPILPPRLRLSDEDGGEEDTSDMENDEQHHSRHATGFTRSPSYHAGLNHLAADFDRDQEMDLDASELERYSTYHNPPGSSMRLNVNQFLDTMSEESRADGERIEYLLLEMASRQRARARTIPTPDPVNSTTLESGSLGANRAFPTSGTAQNSSTSVLSSSRRRAGAAGGPFATSSGKQNTVKQNRRDQSPQKNDRYSHSFSHAGSNSNDTSMLPVGKAIDPLEKEELVSLIMTSLRRKVAIAEEEGWMYGDHDSLGTGIGVVGIDGEPFD